MATKSLPVSHQEVGLCPSLNLGRPVTVQTKAARWKRRCACLYACLSEDWQLPAWSPGALHCHKKPDYPAGDTQQETTGQGEGSS